MRVRFKHCLCCPSWSCPLKTCLPPYFLTAWFRCFVSPDRSIYNWMDAHRLFGVSGAVNWVVQRTKRSTTIAIEPTRSLVVAERFVYRWSPWQPGVSKSDLHLVAAAGDGLTRRAEARPCYSERSQSAIHLHFGQETSFEFSRCLDENRGLNSFYFI